MVDYTKDTILRKCYMLSGPEHIRTFAYGWTASVTLEYSEYPPFLKGR